MSREVDDQYWKDLVRAVRHNQIDVVKEMIKDVDAEKLSSYHHTGAGNTLLIEATRLGHEDMMKLLIEKGVDVNVPATRTNETALDTPLIGMSTAKKNRIIKMLLAAGAEDKTGEYTSKTDLMYAIEDQNLDEVKRLVAEGADLNAKDNKGSPIWEYALHTKNAEIMQTLLSAVGKDGKKMDIEQENAGGKTALSYAVIYSEYYKDMAKLLIENGADVNARSSYETTKDYTPLMFAHDAELTEMLIKAGADVNAKATDGTTPVMGKCTDVLRVLAENGADLSVMSPGGLSLMSYAALKQDVEQIKFLKEQGLDINAPDKNGWTPLMYAVVGKNQFYEELNLLKTEETSLDAAKQMLLLGAKVSIADSMGRTAVDLADERCVGLREFLESSAALEKKELKQYLGMQVSVSNAVGDRKIQEAHHYATQEKGTSQTVQREQQRGFIRQSEGR